jgi:tRNA threonylcarbamoyladenosine biosynthesis protein TsaB
MKILAFDTALGACSVGLWDGRAVTAHESIAMTQGHAEALMPMIERVMAAGQLTYADLDRMAVTVGPGSFTGLRVGIATARGLAMAADKPAVGVTTTECLAASVANPTARILAVVDSKRGDVFAQLFDANLTAVTAIENIPDGELKRLCGPTPLHIVGDAALRASAVLQNALSVDVVTSCAVRDVAARGGVAALGRGPEPVYVRAPDVTLSPTGGLLRP